MSTIEELRAEIQLLADRSAITDVLIRYARAVDRLDVDAVASCFTDDVERIAADGQPLSGGIDALLATLRTRRAVRASTHLLGDITIDVRGASAHTEASALVLLAGGTGADADRLVIRGVRYSDDLVRSESDGAWRISRRQHIADWAGVTARIEATLPPPATPPWPAAGPD